MFRKIVIILTLVLVGIQFIPTSLNVSTELTNGDFIKSFEVPNEIANQMKYSCYDCHSNNTIYPWYSKFQPISYFMNTHIIEGRKALNFSTFNSYSLRKKRLKIKRIINQIKENKMPIYSYQIMHRKAKIEGYKKDTILAFFNQLKQNL